MTLSLYQRAGCIVFLDDESDFLEILKEVIPSGWMTQMYDDPEAIVARIRSESNRLADEAWHHHTIVERSGHGESAISQLLAYWRNDGFNRYTTTRLLVIDYSMPRLSGADVLEQLGDWVGSRIMLTGQADELVAVNAFNQGLIQKYIPKQSSNLASRLVDAIAGCLSHPASDDLGKIWRNNLTREQFALIKDAVASNWIENLIRSIGLVEYAVVGAPFGVLGLNAAGQAYWIQIEQTASTRSLDELTETLSAYNLSVDDLANIRSGKAISDFELQLALQTSVPLRFQTAVLMPHSDSVSAAVFSIDPKLCPGPSASFDALMAQIESGR